MKLVKMSIVFKKELHLEARDFQLFATWVTDQVPCAELTLTTAYNFLFLIFKKVFKSLLTIFKSS